MEFCHGLGLLPVACVVTSFGKAVETGTVVFPQGNQCRHGVVCQSCGLEHWSRRRVR